MSMKDVKNLLIEGTSKTSLVDFNQLTGELILSGKSIPENTAKVYEPLLQWINEYVKSPRQTTNLCLNLEYFNTSSSIWHAKMFKALSNIIVEDAVLFIHIYFDIEDFDDMDMEELKNIVSSLVDNIGEVKISLGVKTYGIDSSGKALREPTILI
jgi:hypothetical protein